MTYAAVLVFFGFTVHAWGQPLANYQREELERRVSILESQNLEHRVTVMETILIDLQSNAVWLRFNMGGTGLLIAEAVTRTVRRRINKDI